MHGGEAFATKQYVGMLATEQFTLEGGILALARRGRVRQTPELVEYAVRQRSTLLARLSPFDPVPQREHLEQIGPYAKLGRPAFDASPAVFLATLAHAHQLLDGERLHGTRQRGDLGTGRRRL